MLKGFISELPITLLMALGGWKLLQFGKGIFYDQAKHYKELIADQEKHYQEALNL